MKTPWWEITPGAVVDLLLSKRFVQVDLYTFTPKVGQVFRWAESMFDVKITSPAITWSKMGPLFIDDGETAQGHWTVGTDVDTWQVGFAIRSEDPFTGSPWPDKIGNIPILVALRAGILDGADVQVDTAIFPLWPTDAEFPDYLSPTGIVTVFSGQVAEVDLSQTQVGISINSYMDMFNTSMPRNVYQASCRHTLYDVGCTLNKNSFKTTLTAAAGTTQSIIKATGSAPAGSGTLALGRITCTSGANQGFSRTVRTATVGSPGTYVLLTPFFYEVNPGDIFTGYAGCNKTYAQCTQFNNKPNYGAERWVPSPETAV